MVLTAYGALSPAIGLLVTVADVMRKHHRQLDVSVETSGPHAFTVRPSAFVACAASVHRIPRPTLVTIAKRPS
jgi:hypothetical protein